MLPVPEHAIVTSLVDAPPKAGEGDVSNAVLCGLVGGVLATMLGRKRTRIDNFMIASLFTGFAAYRDPRSELQSTLLIAAAEGALWGAMDHLIPNIKDRFFDPHQTQREA